MSFYFFFLIFSLFPPKKKRNISKSFLFKILRMSKKWVCLLFLHKYMSIFLPSAEVFFQLVRMSWVSSWYTERCKMLKARKLEKWVSILVTYSNLCKFGGFVSSGCQILGHQKVVLYLKEMYLLSFLLGVCVQQGQSSEPAQLATVTRLQVTCQRVGSRRRAVPAWLCQTSFFLCSKSGMQFLWRLNHPAVRK